MAAAAYRVGLDIGGTFTDLVLLHEPSGAIRWHKVLTTPRAPEVGALRGLREVCGQARITFREFKTVLHATTLVANAIIEGKGARTALLTTAGFRDILEMGREQRYDIYDLFLQFPSSLVPRRWRCEVEERITRDGEIRRPLDLAAVRDRVAQLVDQGVEALAVSFLHAYRNPVHEQRVAELVQREFPRLFISISSEVCPEIREYERASTTACNAFVQPLIDSYLARLESALATEGFTGRFFLMLSSGTLATPAIARRYPIRLLESGPAAGALVAGYLGAKVHQAELVSFDMGGTTAKISLIRNGVPAATPMTEVARIHRFKNGSGLPVKATVVDVIEIGAGGGSIARGDGLGLLRVGPDSAGADPGPAAYGRGGREATVTDACVMLGYFDPERFLGGAMRLDRDAAQAAVAAVGRLLGLDLVETAWGIYAIVCENMAQAARLYLIERGQDPRRFALMGFGGAGPATAARVARLLAMQTVLIPPASGVASALGLLVAPLGFDLGHSLAGELDELDWGAVDRLYARMEEEGRTIVIDAGVPLETIRFARRAEMRYAGQFHDLEVDVPPQADAPHLRERFEVEYSRLFGGRLTGYPVQVLNWRVRVTGPLTPVNVEQAAPRRASGVRETGRRPIYVPEQNGFRDVSVHDRYTLAPGTTLSGPAIIEEPEATTVLWEGDRLTVDAHRNLVIHTGVPAHRTIETVTREATP